MAIIFLLAMPTFWHLPCSGHMHVSKDTPHYYLHCTHIIYYIVRTFFLNKDGFSILYVTISAKIIHSTPLHTPTKTWVVTETEAGTLLSFSIAIPRYIAKPINNWLLAKCFLPLIYIT